MTESDGYTSPDNDERGLGWMDNKKASLPYILGNSWKEIERRKTQHVIFQYALGRASAGAWAMDIAGLYPNCIVDGIDVPQYKFNKDDVPNNCNFTTCTITEPLPFEDSTFDYVFIRHMGLAVKAENWPAFLIELKRVMKPGGYLEWMDTDGAFHGGPEVTKFMSDVVGAIGKNGYDIRLARHNHRMVATAGFSDVAHNVFSIPIGSLWNEVIGRAFSNDFHQGLQSLRNYILLTLNISTEEYDRRLTTVVHEWNHVLKAFANHRIVVSRKALYNIDIDDPK
ncbi:S-adenosyl-L-methionine-dependent methyltransferase [Jimgerdemannia flammicorona]|uniref:S-adenosyl-L-methionine-dependent methyltransferase n=1 Tax=Jimgerdemannia flammicorona TaxID=994334 RepID=A0A433QT98_9FUNG|nr:S-adenosyl-L-methionine-dependent methyltransferase [Jimgerdemannia flammicorona]